MHCLLSATERHGVLWYVLRLLYKLPREAYDVSFPLTTTMSHLVRNVLAKSTTLTDMDRDVLDHVAGLLDKFDGGPPAYRTYDARYKEWAITFEYRPAIRAISPVVEVPSVSNVNFLLQRLLTLA